MFTRGDAVGTIGLNIASGSSLRRNASLPSRAAIQLPLEILQKTFIFLTDLYPPRKFNRPSSPEWRAIMYVCRYWRSAALGQPELWSSIAPGLSASWSRAMIERSAPLLMRFDVHVGTYYAGGLEPLVASELILSTPRIRTLRLSGHDTDILKVLNSLHGPSLLVSLSLWISTSAYPVELPASLFDRNMPHFRRLTFESFTCVRAPHWLFGGITHFTTSAEATLHELLDALRAMPQLEVLCMPHIQGAWDVRGAPEQVPLSHLTLLSLGDLSLHRPMRLFPHINTHPTLRRHLSFHLCLVLSWDSWANLLAAMCAFIPRDSAPGIDDGDLRVSRVIGGPGRGSLEFWSRTGSKIAGACVAAREEALFLFRVNWSRFIPTEGLLNPFFQLAGLSTYLHTARVEDLTVAPEAANENESTTGKHEIDLPEGLNIEEKWQALLMALPSVKTLRLHRGSPECLDVLRAFSASAGFILLHLQRVIVVQSTVRYNTMLSARQDGITVASASSVMASRKFMQGNVGVELVEAVTRWSGLEVVLVGCDVDEEALDTLRKRARVNIIEDEWAYVQEYM